MRLYNNHFFWKFKYIQIYSELTQLFREPYLMLQTIYLNIFFGTSNLMERISKPNRIKLNSEQYGLWCLWMVLKC